jgi:hypothetical protein
MESKTIRAQERPANRHLLVVDCGQGDELPRGFKRLAPTQPRLWIIVDGHSRMIRDIQWGSGQVHELYQLLLKHSLPRLIVTGNDRALGNRRKGGDGNVQP